MGGCRAVLSLRLTRSGGREARVVLSTTPILLVFLEDTHLEFRSGMDHRPKSVRDTVITKEMFL